MSLLCLVFLVNSQGCERFGVYDIGEFPIDVSSNLHQVLRWNLADSSSSKTYILPKKYNLAVKYILELLNRVVKDSNSFDLHQVRSIVTVWRYVFIGIISFSPPASSSTSIGLKITVKQQQK